MGKNIVIINGSLRLNGNTDTIIKSLLKGADNPGTNINQFVLRDININDCKACYYCYRNDTCSINDDMQNIHNKIQKSDILILASPMYWWGVTGLMKTFIDRLYLYYSKRNANLIARKKLLLIMPMNVNAKQHGNEAYLSEIEPVKMTSRYIFKRLGMEIIDILFYPGLNAKGDAIKNKEYQENLYNMGQKLSQL